MEFFIRLNDLLLKTDYYTMGDKAGISTHTEGLINYFIIIT